MGWPGGSTHARWNASKPSRALSCPGESTFRAAFWAPLGPARDKAIAVPGPVGGGVRPRTASRAPVPREPWHARGRRRAE
eukprot:4454624-Alexandrium_andersonii.AAC.1